MASSSSQSAQATVSDVHQRETKRMKETPKVSHASQSSMEGRPWTQMEDIKLLKHVVVHGGRKWSKLSHQLHGRSPDSCKVRWFNKWNPLLERTFGMDAERYLVKRVDDHTRKHTEVDSSAGTDDVQSDSTTKIRPSMHESDLSCLSSKSENSSEIDFIGKSMSKGTSDHGQKQTILMAKGDRDMTSDANPSSTLVFPSMNLMSYPINNNEQQASTPKFIDFLGVGDV